MPHKREQAGGPAHLLRRIEEIANLSALMLAAARAGNWHQVEQFRESAEIAIDEVRLLSTTVVLSAEERRVKLLSMQRILANDGQILELSQPWLRRVGRWLSAGGRTTSPFEGMQR